MVVRQSALMIGVCVGHEPRRLAAERYCPRARSDGGRIDAFEGGRSATPRGAARA